MRLTTEAPTESARHLRVWWHRAFPDEPVELFSAIGPDGYEVRKVDVFRDGSAVWADATRESGTTALGDVPVPPTREIDAMDEFTAVDITAAAFEEVWRRARSHSLADPAAG